MPVPLWRIGRKPCICWNSKVEGRPGAEYIGSWRWEVCFLSFLRAWARRGLQPNTVSFNTVINACAKMPVCKSYWDIGQGQDFKWCRHGAEIHLFQTEDTSSDDQNSTRSTHSAPLLNKAKGCKRLEIRTSGLLTLRGMQSIHPQGVSSGKKPCTCLLEGKQCILHIERFECCHDSDACYSSC